METLAISLNDGNIFWVVIGGIAIVSILCSAAVRITKSTAQERSRREIAAYIAEGTMTPEQGERLMSAGGAAEQKHA